MPLRAAASIVASESTATVTRAPHSRQRTQAVVVDRLVREEEIVGEAGAGQAEQLARRRTGEAEVAAARLLPRERGALVRLHVRPQPRAGKRGGHRVEVAGERRRVDHQRRSREIGDARSCTPSLVEKLADLGEHARRDVVGPAREVLLIGGHRGHDPRRGVGFEQSRIAYGSRGRSRSC